MERWFSSTLTGPTQLSILIGADCPRLQCSDIELADQLLRTHDVVLGPAMDGGYYLIGLRGSWSCQGKAYGSLFHDIPWSTDQVLAITRDRLKTAGLSYAELPAREDVDTVRELNNLRDWLEANQAECPELRSGIQAILS
jgi:uncharacterized protein